MKKFLLIAVMALTVLSCNKQKQEVPIDPENLTGKLTISIVGDDSKATGALPTTESTINTVDVFLFNGELLVTKYTFSPADVTATKGKFSVKAGSVDIFVVANAPAGTFTSVVSRTTFNAVKATLAQTANSLPMVSETLAKGLIAGTDNVLDAKLGRLGARVALSTVTVTPVIPAATFKLEKVYMLNANTKSTYGSATKETLLTSDLGYGGKGTIIPGGVSVPDLGSAVTAVSGATPAYFYVFENKGTGAGNLVKPATPTRLIIEGMWDGDGAGATAPVKTYYAVTVNEPVKSATEKNSNTTAGTNGKYVERNTQYDVRVTIKAQGMDDPTEEPVNSTLEVTVSVKPWELITQHVTFE